MVAVWNSRRNCLEKLLNHPGVELDTRDSQGRSLEEVIMWVSRRSIDTILSFQGERRGTFALHAD